MAPVRDGRALFFFPVVSLLSSQYNVSEHSDPGCVRAGGAFFSPRRLSFEVQHKRCRDPDDACKTQKVFFTARITTLGTSRRHRAGKWMQLNHKPGPSVWRLLLHLESRTQLAPGMGLTEVKGVFSLLFFFTTSTAPAALKRRSRGSGAGQGEASSHADQHHGQGAAKTADCPWMKKPRGNTEPPFPTRTASPAPAHHNTRSHTRWLAPRPSSKLQCSSHLLCLLFIYFYFPIQSNPLYSYSRVLTQSAATRQNTNK